MSSRIVYRSSTPRALICLLALSCGSDPVSPPTGSLEVRVSLSGADLPELYTVVVSGRSRPNNPVTTAATVPGLPAGEHSVRLDIPVNCQVAGGNPRNATIVGGQTTVVSFTGTCARTTRSLTLITSTTGSDVDPNGYVVDIQSTTIGNTLYERRVQLATTGQTTISNVPSSAVRVTLIGLALNCNLAGVNPRILEHGSTEPSVLSYQVSCVPATAELAYVVELGSPDQSHTDIRIVTINGVQRPLTSDQFADSDPAWAPDGERLAFSTNRDGNREIYVIDADGSNAVRLTNHLNEDFGPSWSPDGQRIAFVSNRSGNDDIFVMNADGTGVVRLTTDDARDLHPAWSPDGRTIAFTRDREVPEIYTMEASGAAQTRLTRELGRHPAWSPDGARLAFGSPYCRGYGCPAIITLKEGTAPATLLSLHTADRPAWSPDGRRIAVDRYFCDFYGYECTQDDVFIMTVDGTDQVRLVTGHSAVWRPRHD